MAIEMAILQRYKHNITRDMISNNLFSTCIFYKCFFFFFCITLHDSDVCIMQNEAREQNN